MSTHSKLIRYGFDLKRKLTKETKDIIVQVQKRIGNEHTILFHAYNMVIQVQQKKYLHENVSA